MLQSNTTFSNAKRPWIRESHSSIKNPFARIPIDPLTKGVYVPAILLIVTSLILIGFALREASRTKSFLARAIPATAIVRDVQYKASSNAKKSSEKSSAISILSFKDASGMEHQVKLSGQRNIGQAIPILYDPMNQSEIILQNSNSWTLSIVFLALGVTEFLFGLIWGMRIMSSRAVALSLMNSGQIVEAVTIGIKKRTWSKRSVSKPTVTVANMSLGQYKTVKSTTDFALEAEWSDPRTGQKYTFISPRISFELTEELIGKKVQVYIDPQFPERYYFSSHAVHAIC